MEAPEINYMYNKKETHCQTVSELISTVVRSQEVLHVYINCTRIQYIILLYMYIYKVMKCIYVPGTVLYYAYPYCMYRDSIMCNVCMYTCTCTCNLYTHTHTHTNTHTYMYTHRLTVGLSMDGVIIDGVRGVAGVSGVEMCGCDA